MFEIVTREYENKYYADIAVGDKIIRYGKIGFDNAWEAKYLANAVLRTMYIKMLDKELAEYDYVPF